MSKQRGVESLTVLKDGKDVLSWSEEFISHLEDEPGCAEMLKAVAKGDLQTTVTVEKIVAIVPELDEHACRQLSKELRWRG